MGCVCQARGDGAADHNYDKDVERDVCGIGRLRSTRLVSEHAQVDEGKTRRTVA